ncbi:uncharacterized protein CMU_006050 [Cryptosporidium muris RN66]|uniref:Uncharacterized protein n=1 Tax=Cryptosporidium muris (strain RN66) TaxID=441375 RepID=B6AHI7_CRYMR|nr:uncharacterized protein CMU_006050 [Cryptosporidium muris RN66]EEA07682.1 hypothetical protein, conserved [Cryptosporidium muris RN66]|eukprot:XP_002142031.1 hypothetical protein [Cryptosporidium muris RN66]
MINLFWYILFFLLNFWFIDCRYGNSNEDDSLIMGLNSGSAELPLINSQYRIRVRKTDPLLRRVVIKGIEPKFPLDINADGQINNQSKYYKSSIPIHVPRMINKLTKKLNRIPIISQSPPILPLEPVERLISFAIEICKLPSLWYLELIYCMYKGVLPYINGVLMSYSLQDIVGAALASMDLPSEGFNTRYCKIAIPLFSDIAIQPYGDQICSRMRQCLTDREFLDGENIYRTKKWEDRVINLYKDKPSFYRGLHSRSYAQKIITEILMYHRKTLKIIKNIFLLIRKYFNMIFILNEFLIDNGYKNPDVFEVSISDYSAIGDNSLNKKSVLKMIASCINSLIDIHFLSNTVDYLPYLTSVGYSPFSNTIMEYACTKMISIGFISKNVEVPKTLSKKEVVLIADPGILYRNSECDYSQYLLEGECNKIDDNRPSKLLIETPGSSTKLDSVDINNTEFGKQFNEESESKYQIEEIKQELDNTYTLDIDSTCSESIDKPATKTYCFKVDNEHEYIKYD